MSRTAEQKEYYHNNQKKVRTNRLKLRLKKGPLLENVRLPTIQEYGLEDFAEQHGWDISDLAVLQGKKHRGHSVLVCLEHTHTSKDVHSQSVSGSRFLKASVETCLEVFSWDTSYGVNARWFRSIIGTSKTLRFLPYNLQFYHLDQNNQIALAQL